MYFPYAFICPTVAAHLRGGWGDEPPRQTSAAGPANPATAHDSRVRCSRRLGGDLLQARVV